ncbi:uncharacterized protein PHACADRAFT_203005 [Phanerochaete carnosa HHB-10118-sp]|uniref:Uncharacterized protein n=1 Tax=Phanerochaete carnosa (strain HHB-10118-sp) TaxID=650164 RepID=K5UFS5_PHACS|nr:uncharacterized protein PHACADRAFT_203005 [Phanerochaete carnosa HHB-10118-sp]EKM48286.1 hypothetical protein PHACADRAFT_203005 [Phanerochaete carnosa HHB-10118-sp]
MERKSSSDPESIEVETPPDTWKGWQAVAPADTDVKWEEEGWASAWQAPAEDSWGMQDWAEDTSASVAWG